MGVDLFDFNSGHSLLPFQLHMVQMFAVAEDMPSDLSWQIALLPCHNVLIV